MLVGDRAGEGEGLAVIAGSAEACKSDCELALEEDTAIACEELKTGSRVHPAKITAIINNTPAAKKKIDLCAIDTPNISSSLA